MRRQERPAGTDSPGRIWSLRQLEAGAGPGFILIWEACEKATRELGVQALLAMTYLTRMDPALLPLTLSVSKGESVA